MELLNSRNDRDIVDGQVLGGRPWIFKTDESFEKWQEEVSGDLALSRESIRLVGSAATGFSLSPEKPGRPFRERPDTAGTLSDIDVALVDQALFLAAWEAIVQLDRGLRLGPKAYQVRQNVYWGLVADFSVPRNTQPSRRLLGAMSALSRRPPLRGYKVRCRIYRRLDDLRAYHMESLRKLRQRLQPREDVPNEEQRD